MTTQTGSRASRWVARRFGGPEVLELEELLLPPPASGQVAISVVAVGVNPADFKSMSSGERSSLPLAIGYEAAGTITAIGPGTRIASGRGEVGQSVIVGLISGAYSSALVVRAGDVFAMPASVDFAAAANLLLASSTAADLLEVARIREGDTLVVHGASGAVGLSVVQQAVVLGARVIGTASETNFERLTAFGAIPVAYGSGLIDRIRALAPGGVVAALDTVGTDEAVNVSLELVSERNRIVTTVAFEKAIENGFRAVGRGNPESGPFRAAVRTRLIDLAARGALVVPVARRFPFSEAPAALDLLRRGHPGGKLALLVE